jgi:hypothetical protein
MDRPTHDVSVDESYFVEALTGPGKVRTFLDYFPESVYNTSPDSRLYKLLYSLIGPAGVGALKLNYFYGRLQFEEHGLTANQLDKLYGNPFRFARNFDEDYLSNWKGLLSSDLYEEIKALDESYRTRAVDYFQAARLGGTVEGMRLASKSALGYNTRIIETYQYLFNEHSDMILKYKGIPNGNKDGNYTTSEFVVAPNDPLVDEPVEMTSQEAKLLDDAIGNLKPVNTFQTTQFGQSDRYVLNIKSNFASSEFHQAVRFVTGSSNIKWPDKSKLGSQFSSIYWVESGLEKEAPRVRGDVSQHYQGFYKPKTVTSSSEKRGQFNEYFVNKFPELKSSTGSSVWSSSKALAPYPETLTVTRHEQDTNTALINREYPIEYLNLPNVPTLSYDATAFWASDESSSGSEYLEIDLGSTQAVNFLIFEVLGTPLDIKIEYDAADISGHVKNYQTVTFEQPYEADLSLNYDGDNLNKWQVLPYNFQDINNNIIYTRYIKITFTRVGARFLNQSFFLYDQNTNPPIQRAWSVIVKNLRIGRNIS